MSRKKPTQLIPVHCAHDRLADVGELTPHPKNPNRHSEDQIKALAAVIRSNGWRRAVVVSKRSGLVIVGHGAIEAGRLLGCKVPVNDQEFGTESDELAHLVADNRLHELSEIDTDALARMLRDLEGSIAPEAMGFQATEISDMLNALTESVLVKTLEIKTPPKMAWTLIGIPLVRFSEINSQVEAIAKISGVICEQTVNDDEQGTDKNGQP